MRAFNAFTCASNSSMRSSLAAICARSWSIRANSGATRRAPSLFGESFFLCAMASVNQLAAVGSTPQTRVTTPQSVSSYVQSDLFRFSVPLHIMRIYLRRKLRGLRFLVTRPLATSGTYGITTLKNLTNFDLHWYELGLAWILSVQKSTALTKSLGFICFVPRN